MAQETRVMNIPELPMVIVKDANEMKSLALQLSKPLLVLERKDSLTYFVVSDGVVYNCAVRK
jgi:hypothetical protein